MKLLVTKCMYIYIFEVNICYYSYFGISLEKCLRIKRNLCFEFQIYSFEKKIIINILIKYFNNLTFQRIKLFIVIIAY